MSRRITLPLLSVPFALLIALLPLRGDNARAGDDISSSGYRAGAIEMALQLVQSRRDEINRELARGDITSDTRDKLNRELASLETDIDTYARNFSGMWDLMDGMKQDLKDLEHEAGLVYNQKKSLNASWYAAKSIKEAGAVDWLNLADSGVDMLLKVKSAADTLNKAEALGKSGPATGLAKKLAGITWFMSNFGDKVPLIGKFVKAYGDIGGQMLENVYALEDKLNLRADGQMMVGVLGLKQNEMLNRLEQLGYSNATRVAGLRTVFRADEEGKASQYVIWDEDVSQWKLIAGLEGKNAEETLRQRYLRFAQAGNYKPTPDQIANFKSVIVLSIPEHVPAVAPGQILQFAVEGRLAEPRANGTDNVPAHRIAVTTIPAGEGEFVGDTDFTLGKPIQWKAPPDVARRVQLVVDMAPEVKQVMQAMKPVSATVFTASPATVQMQADTLQAAPGQLIKLTTRVLDAGGNPIADDVSTPFVKMDFQGQGTVSESKATKGVIEEVTLWRVPETPGVYTVNASFKGAHPRGLVFKTAWMPAQAALQITVRPFQYQVAVDTAQVDVTSAGAARINVSVTNSDQIPVTFSVSLKTTAAAPAWNTGALPEPFLVPAGQTLGFPFEVSLKDPVNAAELAVKISAEPFGAKPGGSVVARFRNVDPSASLNRTPGCDEVVHRECRARVEAGIGPEMANCEAMGKGSVKAFKCAMDVTVKGADRLKQCADESACVFSKSDQAWGDLARRRLKCIDENLGGDLARCMGEQGEMPVCNKNALETCIVQAQTYFDRTARPYCESAWPKHSCDWFRCLRAVEADLVEHRISCAEQNLCEAAADAVAEALSKRGAAHCLSRNTYACPSCLGPDDAAKNAAYIQAETLARDLAKKNPPPEPDLDQRVADALPPGTDEAQKPPPDLDRKDTGASSGSSMLDTITGDGAATSGTTVPANPNPNIGANLGLTTRGSGTPDDPWVGRTRPKVNESKTGHFRWNQVGSERYDMVKSIFITSKQAEGIAVRNYRDCYRLALPRKNVVVCEAVMTAKADGRTQHVPISVDMAWLDKNATAPKLKTSAPKPTPRKSTGAKVTCECRTLKPPQNPITATSDQVGSLGECKAFCRTRGKDWFTWVSPQGGPAKQGRLNLD